MTEPIVLTRFTTASIALRDSAVVEQFRHLIVMNKQVKQIRTEIERLMSELKNGNYYLDNSEQAVGYVNALADIEAFINNTPDSHFIDGNKMIDPSKDLEKAAWKYAEQEIKTWDDTEPNERKEIHDDFIAGAEWQAKQMPMPEDTVLFNKGVEEGKRLMMEDAIGVEVVGKMRDLRIIDSTQRCLFDAKRGDWLRIIIVKED